MLSSLACIDKGDNGPSSIVTPKDDPNYGGTFVVEITESDNPCQTLVGAPDGVYEIVIDGDYFEMSGDDSGDYYGALDEESLEAEGATEMTMRHLNNQCRSESYYSLRLTFVDYDSFVGTITYRAWLLGACSGIIGCKAEWKIAGTREQEELVAGTP